MTSAEYDVDEEYWYDVDEAADYAADEAYSQFLEDEARNAVWHAWIERVREERGARFDFDRIAFWTTGPEGEHVPVPLLPPDAEKAAAEELLRDGEPDVEGDEDGPEFVWKTDPLDALARVRPRVIASVRPSPIVPRLVPIACQRTGARARTPRPVRRVARTVGSRGDPDPEPEPDHHVVLGVVA